MEILQLKVPYSHKIYTVAGSEKDDSIMRDIRLTGYYDRVLMDFLTTIVQPDFVCLDIGANLGVVSYCLSDLANLGKVYAFEASGKNFEYLIKNLKDNNVDNVIPLHLGILDKTCTTQISYVEDFAGGSFMNTTGADDERAIHEEIACVSLDEWVVSEKIERLDFIKMDIEGAELKALDGAKQTIARFKPDMVLEYNEVTLERFFAVEPKLFFERVLELYPYVYLLGRDTPTLTLVHDFDMLHEVVMSHGGVDNLFCTFSQRA